MDIRGTFQNLNNKNGNKNKIRERSAAFPLNLPYRLINMFSIHGDTILDPFWGTGTTTLAAMISARNSIGYEINPAFLNIFKQNLLNIKKTVNSINNNRLEQHVEFSRKYKKSGKDLKYTSTHYNFPIMTKQEVGILFYTIKKCVDNKNNYTVYHEKFDFEQKTKLIQSRLVI
jgi:16S rRNA G966 N2-methylase RsmD